MTTIISKFIRRFRWLHRAIDRLRTSLGISGKVRVISVDIEVFSEPRITIYEGKDAFVHGYPFDGYQLGYFPGIRVTPHFYDLEKATGYIYVTQLCHYHQLRIITTDGRAGALPDFDYPLADGQCHNNNRIFRIRDGKSFLFWNDKESDPQAPYFWDSPLRQWETFWKSAHYQIKFETFFQYSPGDQLFQQLSKLASFKWDLDFKVTMTDNGLQIENIGTCSIKTIKESIKIYKNKDGIDPTKLKELRTTVERFRQSGVS